MSKDNKYGAWVFQSTLPREERRGSNSTFDKLEISIHAPTRGATQVPAKNATTT